MPVPRTSPRPPRSSTPTGRPRRLPRLPRRIPRSAYGWWAACLVLALTSALLVGGTVQRAREAQARYGRTRPVLVATADLSPGDHLDATHAGVRQLPTALAPPGALSALPKGRTITARIGRGEPVLAMRVGDAGKGSGPAALMPSGSRAVAIPVPVPGLPVEVGSHVDLVAPTGGASVIAGDGIVLTVAKDAVTVAVDAEDVGAVARALGNGGVVLALRAG